MDPVIMAHNDQQNTNKPTDLKGTDDSVKRSPRDLQSKIDHD